ncbi:MAG: marine proteobacterial sortase target protein [Nitrospira sp. BO4]|jgi:Ca-activated chloride channel family protein|nr:marine proteobacterial sortase target protein [Nitrospira sp. BO4]
MLHRSLLARPHRALHLATSFVLCSALLLLCLDSPSPAEPIEPESLSTGIVPTMGLHDVKEGTLLFKTNQQGRYRPASILKTDVQIAVTGMIARAAVRQEFTNPSKKKGDWLEGIYVFPLPETAAVDHLRMKIGERIVEGQIKERAEAKKTYEQAKHEGKRTSLVEQERPNIFTTSVANIGPGERVIVEIEYQETVRYDNGQFQLRFPMAVGQRYIPGTPVIIEGQEPKGSGTVLDTDRVPDSSRITPPVHSPGQGSINPLSLALVLNPGFPVAKVESPYHPIIVIPDPDGGFQVSLKEEAVPADKDFQLIWHLAPHTAPLATIFTEEKHGETYAMLTIAPPTQPDEKAVRVPRDLIFVIDTSGSMAGPSIQQAKASVTAALTRLTTLDRFNVIQFNNTVRSLFPTLEPVTAASMRKAVRYTERMSADGGTEILPALRQALKNPQDPSRIQQIVLLTDGQVGNEEELFEMLHYKLGTRRLFTIGIGSTPNSYLMRKTAEVGRGTFTHIGNIEEVKDRLDALFKKLERPVLHDIAVDPTGWSGTEQYPSQIADLYEGEPIVLAIKARSLPPHATLKGLAGHHPWTLPVSFNQAASQGGLSVFWARQKISALMDETYKGGVEEAIKNAVIDVAVSHHLASKYTSLVAVDVTPARPTDRSSTEQAPAAVQDQASIAALPKTATIGQLQILFGLALLTIAGLVWRHRKWTA